MNNYLPQRDAHQFCANILINQSTQSVHRRIKLKIALGFYLLFALSFCQIAQAQTYNGTETFGDMNQYSFDYTIVCSGDGTSALVTADYTTAQPPGLVPQMQIGVGGPIIGMTGPDPYTYTITGLTDCDFNFRFWMAWAAGGLYISEFLNPTVLPVNLTTFEVTKQGARSVKLKWVTAGEQSSDYFGVERSMDGANWEAVDKVKAAGFSIDQLSYAFVDTDVPSDIYSRARLYYRLRLTDIDDTYVYSDVRSIAWTSSKHDISIYPNPAIDRIHVDLTQLDGADLVEVAVYDNFGKLVVRKKGITNGIELIDLNNLPPATYHVIVNEGDATIFQAKITKLY